MKGVLLVNLGSPDSPAPKDVRTYLDEFLMDERVMDIPKFWRSILVRRIILRKRPEKSAEAYKKIWWKEGSPLVVLSERFHKKVNQKTELPVALGMRYGSMTIKKGLQELHDKGVDDVLVVPLYPHFAMSSTETVEVKAQEDQKEFFSKMKLTFVPAFYKNESYIKVLSESISEGVKDFKYDHILFSYHGLPERHIRKADPTNSHRKLEGICCTDELVQRTCYRHQSYATTDLVQESLGLESKKISSSFQSRLAVDPWLKPYTDYEFERLAKEGKKRLAVVTPAFVADCLETLEEIAMEGKKQFTEAGGEAFKHIPCLNDNEAWVNVMVDWINEWHINETLPA
ncbi:MAG: ferrochelatase [Cellulophaga sp.]